MNVYRIRQEKPFAFGYTPITTMDEKERNTMMDFGIVRLRKAQTYTDERPLERAFLLVSGEITFAWEGKKETITRLNCFDYDPFVLHVPQNGKVEITGVGEDSEVSITATINDTSFPCRLYTDKECASEERGKGTMREASTRIVRTVFDYSNAKYSNLVVGEVIDYPGKWSSYPPHHHPQPEIYYYKFNPENGYGFCQLGENAVMVKNNDTVKIIDELSHPQTTAPGYAMYYLWVIRHLDGNPYITPTFEPEHLWVTNPEAAIWPD